MTSQFISHRPQTKNCLFCPEVKYWNNRDILLSFFFFFFIIFFPSFFLKLRRTRVWFCTIVSCSCSCFFRILFVCEGECHARVNRTDVFSCCNSYSKLRYIGSYEIMIPLRKSWSCIEEDGSCCAHKTRCIKQSSIYLSFISVGSSPCSRLWCKL